MFNKTSDLIKHVLADFELIRNNPDNYEEIVERYENLYNYYLEVEGD